MTDATVAALRRDFPILQRRVNDCPLVYLDSAASAQMAEPVMAAIDDYRRHHHANVHRGAHTLSAEATERYEASRARVARFLGAPDPRGVVFTRNATEALNLIAHAYGRSRLQAGDEVLVSVAEHHANLVPWHLLAQDRGVVIKGVGLSADGRVDLDALEAAIGPRTKVVATFHVSNVLGYEQPLRRIADAAHAVGALFVVDGAQAAPHVAVDVVASGVDAYAFSGHKVGGPTGIGALWMRPDVLETLPPFLGGGEMIRRVEVDRSTYADIPMRFEAGTPAIAEAIGLAAALDYLEAIGLENIWAHDRALATQALAGLDALTGVETYGPRGDDRGGIVPFNVVGVHPHDVASFLDAEGIAVRAGHHCAQPLMKALGVASTARASFWLYTTRDEVDAFVAAVARVRDFFAGDAVSVATDAPRPGEALA
ncbi:MAG: SufS family cysteine desulfurase [Trueperaceae bacterium]|nr:SufS family cysteine desulfurase [Trueperaceae bacterium]